jgi:C-terminal processing protease CtpA/Prc
MTVLGVGGEPSETLIDRVTTNMRRYVGFSSDRYARYHAYRSFASREQEGEVVEVVTIDPDGNRTTFTVAATQDRRYRPRLPVPIAGIRDSANVSWKMLDGGVGYVYVRRIREGLIPALDDAIAGLADARGIIVDVRGNGGGGFDSRRAHLNFAIDRDGEEPERPRFRGPMALLVDGCCISAGEGWASWFVAHRRARLFGEATAGASARKDVYTLTNGLYRVRFPVKAYRGFLNRPIERRGLVPDVPLLPSARDIANGRDTVLEAARAYLIRTAAEDRVEDAGEG